MSSAGERDLDRLLSQLAPSLSETPFRILVEQGPSEAQLAEAFMVCRETEGTTLIVADETTTAADSRHYARITLQIHSSLDAVGLTAAVSGALMRESIPANMVAGYYHDHVFVPWSVRLRALKTLQALSDQSSDSV